MSHGIASPTPSENALVSILDISGHGCGAERRLPVMFWFDRSRRFGDLVPRSAVYHIGLAVALFWKFIRADRYSAGVPRPYWMWTSVCIVTAWR